MKTCDGFPGTKVVLLLIVKKVEGLEVLVVIMIVKLVKDCLQLENYESYG